MSPAGLPTAQPLSPPPPLAPAGSFTAKQVLEHPWIQGNAPETAIDMGNLRKFQASRKLKAAAAKIMAMKKVNLANITAAAKAKAAAEVNK